LRASCFKLAGALGVTLGSLFEADGTEQAAPSPLSTAAKQAAWKDPASGYVRRQLSPAARSPMQLVKVIFPPGQRVTYDQVRRENDVYQQVWLLEGEIAPGSSAPGSRPLSPSKPAACRRAM
jgi:hypothetical protein